MRFEEFLLEQDRTDHLALAKEEKAKADRLKANLKTNSPEYKSAMGSYHYHMMKATSGAAQADHKKQYTEHTKW